MWGKQKASTVLAVKLINELGTKILIQELKIAPPNFSKWKKTGVPIHHLRFLFLKYPNLNVWKEYKEELKKLSVI